MLTFVKYSCRATSKKQLGADQTPAIPTTTASRPSSQYRHTAYALIQRPKTIRTATTGFYNKSEHALACAGRGGRAGTIFLRQREPEYPQQSRAGQKSTTEGQERDTD